MSRDYDDSIPAVPPALPVDADDNDDDAWAGIDPQGPFYTQAIQSLQTLIGQIPPATISSNPVRIPDLKTLSLVTGAAQPVPDPKPGVTYQAGLFARGVGTDSVHVLGVMAAYNRHRAGPRPDLNLGNGRSVTWDQFAAIVAAQPEFQKKLDMVNHIITINFGYKGEGRASGWVNDPAEAMSGGWRANCRESAVAKEFMLRDAGVSASQLSVVTLAAGLGYSNAHVVTLVKDDAGKEYVMDLGRRGGPFGASAARVITVGDAATDPLHMLQRNVTMLTPMPTDKPDTIVAAAKVNSVENAPPPAL